MEAVVLTHFDNILGPHPFVCMSFNSNPSVVKLPESIEKELSTLVDMTASEGFFAHSFSKYTSGNCYFELNSKIARGGREICCITVATSVKNAEMFKPALEAFASKLKKLPDIYKAFHATPKKPEQGAAQQRGVLEAQMRQLCLDLVKVKEDNQSGKILILGLEQAGKTSLLKALDRKEVAANEKPTLGVNIMKIVLSEVELMVYDIGGQLTYRDRWLTTLSTPHALVYVVDTSETLEKRLKETSQEFWRVVDYFGEKQQTKFPILIIGNKVDRNKKASAKDVSKILNLKKLKDARATHVALTSAMTGEGVEAAFKWLVTNLIASY